MAPQGAKFFAFLRRAETNDNVGVGSVSKWLVKPRYMAWLLWSGGPGKKTGKTPIRLPEGSVTSTWVFNLDSIHRVIMDQFGQSCFYCYYLVKVIIAM